MAKCFVTPNKDTKSYKLSLDMFTFLEARYNTGKDPSLFCVAREELEEVLENKDYDNKEEAEAFYRYIKHILKTIPSDGYFFEWCSNTFLN